VIRKRAGALVEHCPQRCKQSKDSQPFTMSV
jgi:hypothetical protein